MSKETFLRLPEEKRTRFLKAAWEEFTHVRFVDASINQIVRKAGIPRGSFYQYFEDKEDLFRYLLDTTRDRYTAAYQRVMEAAGYDMFRTQLLCYDRFLKRNAGEDPAFDRCIQLMRINPGIDMQKMLPKKPTVEWLEGTLTKLDTSRFRRKDTEFVWQVFVLTLMVLAHAIMDSLTYPEKTEEHRQRLEGQLEIIRCGSVWADGPLDPEKEDV